MNVLYLSGADLVGGRGGGGSEGSMEPPKLKQLTSKFVKYKINIVNLKYDKCNKFITKLSLCCSIKLKRFLHKTKKNK